MYKVLIEHLFSILLGLHLRVEVLGHMGTLPSFPGPATLFPMMAAPPLSHQQWVRAKRSALASLQATLHAASFKRESHVVSILLKTLQWLLIASEVQAL